MPPAIPDPADTVLAVEVEGKPSADSAVRPQPDGSLILPAMYAAVHGQAARYQASPDSIGYWTDAKDWISWDIAPARAGAYDVEITYACAEGTGDSEYEVRAGSRQVTGKVRETGGWDRFVSERPGRLRLASGPQTFSLRPLAMPGYAVMNLQRIRLIPR